MIPTEYNFCCQYMSKGFCTDNNEPGCYFDCVKRSCEFCINAKTAIRKSPCNTCYMSMEKEKDARNNRK